MPHNVFQLIFPSKEHSKHKTRGGVRAAKTSPLFQEESRYWRNNRQESLQPSPLPV